MTVIGLHGCKQAPGVTTLALALVAALEVDGGAVLIEADYEGGDLSAVLGRPPTPGWMSLAAAGRHGGVVDLEPHLQSLPAGGRALVAPADPAQTNTALRTMGDRVVELAAGAARHVVVDLGRGVSAVSTADASILVCHPTVAGIEQARVRMDLLGAADANVVVAISAGGPYRPSEVSEALGRTVLGPIPRDDRGVGGLVGVRRGAQRSPLVRFAASVADEVRALSSDRELTW
jgi:MinD-like ATPase involved in chromosome partitioning or flagellar assembly